MVQKQRERDSTSVEDIREGVSEKVSGSKSSGGTLSSLYDVITEEGSTKSGALAGSTAAILGLIMSGILPTTVVPMLLGIVLGGAAFGKVLPSDVYSVMGGIGVASFLSFLLFVNVPIIGLGIITTVLFTLISTGLATAAHQYVSDDPV